MDKDRDPSRDNLDFDEDDPRDPYIMGRPMGRIAAVVFLMIMIVIPSCIAIAEHYHWMH